MTIDNDKGSALAVLPAPALGRVGVWSGAFDAVSVPEMLERACEIEELGFGAIWFPDGIGRDSFVKSSLVLEATDHIAAATGIASIWTRHARVAQACTAALEDAFPGRFLLGLGASHAHIVEGALGGHYEKPLSAMSEYLDGIDESALGRP